MWATPSPSTNRLLLAAWAVFASINVGLMWIVPGKETIPFHLVWISLSLVYGFTSWRMSWMVLALVAVTLSTGVSLAHHAATGEIRWEETAEEPLMATIFVVMVWHVHRRQQLLRQVERVNAAERRRLERQQLVVQLASHQLRTPVTIARGYTEMVRAYHSDAETAGDTEIVLDELDKLGRITQRLLTLMQLDEPYVAVVTDLDAQLVRITRRWVPTAERAWSVSSDIGEVLIDPERFEAAIDSLIENAVKFTSKGQRISVTGSRDDTGWRVEIRDGGKGMTRQEVAALAAHRPGEATGTGTGLGLEIVRMVIEPLEGSLSIESETGEGTTVAMFVPQDSHDTARVDYPSRVPV